MDLFADAGDSSGAQVDIRTKPEESLNHFTVNKDFAERYLHNKQRAELHQLEAKYGKDALSDGSDDDSETDSESDVTKMRTATRSTPTSTPPSSALSSASATRTLHSTTPRRTSSSRRLRQLRKLRAAQELPHRHPRSPARQRRARSSRSRTTSASECRSSSRLGESCRGTCRCDHKRPRQGAPGRGR